MKTDKPMKLLIATPSTGVCRMAYTYSLVRLLMYVSQNRIFEDVETQVLDYNFIEGSGISANRERLVVDFLKSGMSHILFIDEDMYFQPEALYILANRRLPLVGCNYPIRVKNKGFTALKEGGRVITTEESTGIEKCIYTGFGFCLIERQVFEQIERPWFLIGYNKEADIYSTEDAAFSLKVKDAGIDWWVDHDASKKLLHVGNYNYSYKECKDGLS
jgi:hypothetical protein